MDIFNIQALISENKIVGLSDIDPNTSYFQIGVFQVGNRQNSATNANAYKSYVIPVSAIGGGGTTYTGSNGISLVGNDFQFTTQNISQFTNDSGYITSTDVPITINVIPKGNATSTDVIDGSWEFSGNDLVPTTTGSNIGDATHRIGTIFMASTFDYTTDLTWVSTTEKMRLTTTGNLGVGTPGPSARIHSVGSTSDNTAFGLAVDSFAGSNWFNVRNDGAVNVFGGGGNNATFSVRQRDFAFPIAFEVYGNTFNRLIRASDNGTSGSVLLANEAIGIDMYAGTIRLGGQSPGGLVRLDVIPISGGESVFVRAEGGTGGTVIGDDTVGSAKMYMQMAGAVTNVYIRSDGVSFFNGGNVAIAPSGFNAPTSRLHVRGVDATVVNYALKVEDNIGVNLLSVTNSGRVNLFSLPTSSVGLVAGDLWNNLGVVNIV